MQVDEAVVGQIGDKAARDALITSTALDALIKTLAEDGYTVIGPTIRDGTVVLDEVSGTRDLPIGWIDEHRPGGHRVRHTDGNRLFDCVIGAHSWKKYLFPARHRLWSARQNGSSRRVHFDSGLEKVPRYAFLGVRACDLAAIAIQDRVFMYGEHPDPVYTARRSAAVIIAVNCTRCVDTCFCVSMGTGPRAVAGFDLALTEVPSNSRTAFLAEAGSKKGIEWLDRIPSRTADTRSRQAGADLRSRAVADQRRTLDREATRKILLDNLNHRHWEEVGDRCLSCGNCTMACPTCFCSTVEDTTDLAGRNAERWQVWDSCFNPDHSYIHGGSVRKSTGSRYRQWVVHKLATWSEQFGTSGCVGCGRCITWCPVGIDITAEVRQIIGQKPTDHSKRKQ